MIMHSGPALSTAQPGGADQHAAYLVTLSVLLDVVLDDTAAVGVARAWAAALGIQHGTGDVFTAGFLLPDMGGLLRVSGVVPDVDDSHPFREGHGRGLADEAEHQLVAALRTAAGATVARWHSVEVTSSTAGARPERY